jgi:carboxylesterase
VTRTELGHDNGLDFTPGGPVGVLLIHGLGGTPKELRVPARALAHAGHSVLTCTLAGHCGTPEELRTSTDGQWVESVLAAHEFLAKRCDIVIAGGLSMGAILALRLAQLRPDQLHGLLLYAPTLRLDGWSMPWYSFLLRAARPTIVPLELSVREHEPYGLKDERVRSFVVSLMASGRSGEAGVFSTPLRAFANFNRLIDIVKPNLGAVRQPALIVHPRDDDLASLNNAFTLQRELGGLVDTVILDDSYHLVTLDQQRHILVDRSIEFVARLARQSDAQSSRAGDDRTSTQV